MSKSDTKKFHFAFPNTYVLLFGVAVLVAILTYIVPAGTFDRVLNEATGRTAVVAGSFHTIESSPATLKILFSSLYVGFMDVVDINGLVLIMGAAIGVIVSSGAIHAIIALCVRKLGRKTDILFIILMTCFGIASAVVGMAEELIVFLPIIIAVCRALNYDDMTACGVILLGIYSSIGFAPISPYSVVIAQKIAEVPIYSGLGLRIVGMIGAMIIGMAYLILYSRRCAKDPSKSILYDKKTGGYICGKMIADETFDLDSYELTGERKAILLTMLVCMAIVVFGVIQYGWYFEEMSAVFLVMGIVCGLIQNKGKINKTAEDLVKEAGPLVGTCILLALSRSIVYILTEGQIIDTIVNAIAVPLSHLSGLVASWGMYFSQLIVNFFIPSASGQAMVVMPILTPLCDICKIPRNIAVHAFMTADCYGNLIIPTHPTTLAIVGMAGVAWPKWFKFAWKVVVLYSIWSLLLISVGYFMWS